MFKNIGGKIKGLASVIAWLGIIVSVVTGVIYMATAFDGVGIGFLILVLGSLVSWISSWLLYGFGELIENTSKIAKNITPNNTPKPTAIEQPKTTVQAAQPEQPKTAEQPIATTVTITTDEEEVETLPRWAIPSIIGVIVIIVVIIIIASIS